MKVLITGASGFLGSHIVDACLAKGYQVCAIVRPSSDVCYLATLKDKVDIQIGQFTDPVFLDRVLADVDAVIHSAARVSDVGHRNDFLESNVIVTESLVSRAKINNVKRFVHVSSPSVVAELKDQLNINESYPYPERFLNYYCETKAISERSVLQANCERLVTCAIRPRAVWGPRDSRGPFVRLMKMLQQKRLRDVSGGRQVNTSICYVKDAADACVRAVTADAASGNAYFVAHPEAVNLWEFLNRVAETFSLPPVTRSFPPALANGLALVIDLIWGLPILKRSFSPPLTPYSLGMITYSSTYDTSRAQRDLNWQALTPLESAIKEYQGWVDGVGGISAYLSRVH